VFSGSTSTILLIDHSDFPNTFYKMEESISYWIKQLNGSDEIAILGFSDSYPSGYKVYGSGFINSNSENKFDGVF
jgi:hypothetical protein